MNCEMCNSQSLESLGTLGELDHYRCRDCGWEQSELNDLAGPVEEWDDGEPFGSHDMSDDAEVLASAGWGTDEDYGCFGGGFGDEY